MGLRDVFGGVGDMLGAILAGARTSDPGQERLVSERRTLSDRLMGRWGNGGFLDPIPTNVDEKVEGHHPWTEDGAPLVTTPVEHPVLETDPPVGADDPDRPPPER